METAASGRNLVDPDWVDPQAYAVQKKRVRESDVPAPRDGLTYQPPKVEKSHNFIRMLTQLKEIRPDISADWDSISDAQLQNILHIEQTKSHYSVREKPPVPPAAQVEMTQVMEVLKGVAQLVAGLVDRVEKLEAK